MQQPPANGKNFALPAAEPYRRSSDTAADLARLRARLERNPHDAPALLLYATLLGETGDHALALQYAQRAIAQQPDAAAPYLVLGRIQLAAGDAAAGEASFATAIRRAPGDQRIALEAAAALHASGRRVGALAVLQQLQRSARDREPVLILLAEVLIASGRRREAIEVLYQALDIDPRNAITQMLAAAILANPDGALHEPGAAAAGGRIWRHVLRSPEAIARERGAPDSDTGADTGADA